MYGIAVLKSTSSILCVNLLQREFRRYRSGRFFYFASMVAEQMGGILTLSNADELRDELDIPAALNGAAVVMRFGGK